MFPKDSQDTKCDSQQGPWGEVVFRWKRSTNSKCYNQIWILDFGNFGILEFVNLNLSLEFRANTPLSSIQNFQGLASLPLFLIIIYQLY